MNSTHLDEIAAVLRRAEAAAYERGKVDAKRELLDFLGHKDAQIAAAPVSHSDDSMHKDRKQRLAAVGRQRAPKGIVAKLVKRVLSVEAGLAPKDILDRAESDSERMVKPASIRSELRTGKEAGRYRDKNGKWFLVSDGENSETGGDPVRPGMPPVFFFDQRKGE